jgi:hypothetical protein
MGNEGKVRASWTAACVLAVAAAPVTGQNTPGPTFEASAAIHAGTYRWVDGTWTPGALDGTGQLAYSNTCQVPAGTVWTQASPCNTYYDQGRIPSLDDPSYAKFQGVANDQRISAFTFGYCTRAPTGQVDITLSFWETGGDCAAGAVPSAGTEAAVFDFGAAAGFPLPGSAFAGQTTCWFVTIDLTGAEFCLTADGDGVWDDDATDLFVFAFHAEGTDETGPIIAGDPIVAQGGQCIFGSSCPGCGTGLSSEDHFYVEQLCPGGVPSGCYDMGGWPGFPYASFYLELETAGPCSCAGLFESYCTAGTSASGCTAQLSAAGGASATMASGFVVSASSVEGGKDGLFFFGTAGRQANPWGTGTSFVCVRPPVKRTDLLTGAGTAGACNGKFDVDFNALWASSPAKNPGAGSWVQMQLWYRDPANSSNQATSFSDALEFPVCP